MPRHPLRVALTRCACRLLAQASASAQPTDQPVHTTVSDGAFEVRIVVRPLAPPSEPPSTPAAGLRLSPLDRRILERAGTSPQPMQALSNECNHDNDSYFQGRVRRLVRAGMLLRDFDGYRLAGPPPTPQPETLPMNDTRPTEGA
ncbi:MAG: hypothetical protein L0Z62_43045 [Gemmataceae bacterium]|nr:hypothetical protein [Gemmataceae bacterium]